LKKILMRMGAAVPMTSVFAPCRAAGVPDESLHGDPIEILIEVFPNQS
jgi:hypothetical protein